MSRLSQKFVAVLMLLWLPIFTGNALAATIAMQLQRGSCHTAVAMQSMPDMDMMDRDMSEHHAHDAVAPVTADEQTPSCSACGICHLACTGYLAVPNAPWVAPQTATREATPYLVYFVSFSSAPLDPPPLARV